MKTKWAKRFVGALTLLTAGWWSSDIGAGPPDKDKEDKKVTICHKGQTMEVAGPALQAHLNHGDTLGPCSVTPSQNR